MSPSTTSFLAIPSAMAAPPMAMPGKPSITCSPIRLSAWNGRPQQKYVEKEHKDFGFEGRFGPGLPRINDGALLFLLHMISKRKPSPEEGGEGSKIAIVFNGSPLFTGDAGSGESNIRRWIIENDWLDAIVALPDQLFPQ